MAESSSQSFAISSKMSCPTPEIGQNPSPTPTQASQGAVPVLAQATQGADAAQATQGADAAQATQGTDAAEATQGTDAAQATQGTKRKGRTTSTVWDQMERVNSEKAICKHCGGSFAADTVKNGTSGLHGHLKRCHKNPNRKEKGQKSLVFSLPKPGDNTQLVCQSYSYDKIRRFLVEFIIKEELPFRLVESDNLRALIEACEPRFKVTGRMTIYRDILVIYKEEKQMLKMYFKRSKQRVSLTTDTWTSPNNFSYICVTVHYVDHTWKLQKWIIMFCQIKGHKGTTIGRMLEKCLLDWGLEDVFGVTLDNASANTVAIDYLRNSVIGWTGASERADYLHVRCVAHVLALVVKDDVFQYNSSIKRIRSVIKYVTSSPIRTTKFRRYASLEKVETKKGLILDVKTRWNSTYLMLDKAEKYERAFNMFAKEDKEFKQRYIFKEDKTLALPNPSFELDCGDVEFSSSSSDSESDTKISINQRGRQQSTNKKRKKPIVRQHAPYPEDWAYARALVKCLKVFFDSTVKFSALTQVTTHLFLWQLAIIHEQLVDFRDDRTGDSFIASMAHLMFKKYNHYWGKYEDMNAALFFARLLDPREKEGGLEFVLECLYENNFDKIHIVMRKVRQDMERLFEEYKEVHSSSTAANESTSGVTEAETRIMVWQEDSIEARLKLRARSHRKHPSVEGRSELERYLLDDREPKLQDFDILAWWEANSSKYKILSVIAKDILVVPVSSVPSESAFSTGKRVLTAWRSSLSARTIEALLCTQSWLQKPIALDFISDYVPDDNSSIEEELLGPMREPDVFDAGR